MEPFNRRSEDAFPSPRTLNWLVTALLVYFGARLLYFALSISPYLPPDEVTHFGVCQVFSKYLLLPVNSPESYQYGLVTNIPWLYYWAMGKLLWLNVLGVSDLVFLRLMNIPIAFATVYYAWRLVRLLTGDRLAWLLVLVAMTNTLMFSFLSASVSYDNLTNLLAAMALYYLFAFFRGRSGRCLALWLLSLLAGCLTKITFLPLALLLVAVFVIREIRYVAEVVGAVRRFVGSPGRGGTVLLAGIVVGLVLNGQLYGGNLARYGTVNPAVEVVLPLENALKYRLTARNYILKQYREGKVTVEQARQMAQQISHAGDRQDAVSMVENYAYLQQAGFQPIGMAPYSAMWVLQMFSTSFGIKAHIGMPNHGFSFIPLMLLILFVLAALLARWRPWDLEWLPTSLMAIALGYAAVLVTRINYPAYLESKDIVLTVAGRYIFPVMAPIYAVCSLYLMRLFRGEKARLALFCAAALILVVSDFPFFLSRVTPEWYDWTPR